MSERPDMMTELGDAIDRRRGRRRSDGSARPVADGATNNENGAQNAGDASRSSGEGGGTRRRGTGSKRKRGGTARFIRDIIIIFLAALLISFLIKTFLVRSFYIPSGSMENTLQINDRIIVDELVPKAIPLKRGDVVVFTDPGGWLTGESIPAASSSNPIVGGIQSALTTVGLGAQDSDDHLIKRVIGLPGDKVSCCGSSGKVEVNGVALTEPYANVPAGQPADRFTFSVTVPKGELWVMGDNRYDSADSAYHFNGKTPPYFVPIKDVVGRAFVITWPSQHWGWLGDYPEVFRGTDTK